MLSSPDFAGLRVSAGLFRVPREGERAPLTHRSSGKQTRHYPHTRRFEGVIERGGVAPRPRPCPTRGSVALGGKAVDLAAPAATSCSCLLENGTLSGHRTYGDVRPAQVAQPAQKCPAANQNPRDEA